MLVLHDSIKTFVEYITINLPRGDSGNGLSHIESQGFRQSPTTNTYFPRATLEQNDQESNRRQSAYWSWWREKVLITPATDF